jgi:hypothetical protein
MESSVQAGVLKSELLGELERYWRDQLASVQADEEQRVAIERQLLQVRFLPRREFSAVDEIIVPSALVEIETLREDGKEGVHSWCYLIPTGGGLILSVAGRPVQVLTPQSPLGSALLGKKRGDDLVIPAGTKSRKIRVVTFS